MFGGQKHETTEKPVSLFNAPPAEKPDINAKPLNS